MSNNAVYSLAEIEAMARKAARGAGYPWGLAEEAGRGARWLCAWGQGGVEAVATHLGTLGGSEPDLSHQREETGGLHLTDAVLAGALIADHLAEGEASPIASGVILSPLLLGIVGAASEVAGFRVDLSSPEGTYRLGKGGPVLMSEKAEPATISVRVEQASGSETASSGSAKQWAVSVDAAQWSVLEGYAHKTYVPATEASRALGAGAGLSDND